ncbi:PilZ domain-containing protein [Halobacteriovorax sp.]|uniref:PilZ domain-containing protein n=1 Tax=Halobacteriovorax sp. TaxID=2020862 RepID=UPI0035635AC0
MTIKDANKKHYFSLVDLDEVFEAFNTASKDKLNSYIWEQGKSESDVEEFQLETIDDNRKLILSSTGGFLSKLSKSKLTDKEVFLKVNYNRFQYFTYGILKYNQEDKNYFIHITKDVYKSQQRSNYRLSANVFVKIQFKINDTVYDAHDISAGGTSFSIDEVDLVKYPEGEIYTNCLLRLNVDKFEIPQAKVAKVWAVKDTEENPTGVYKVGIAFIDVPKGTEEELFKSINGEARAEEIRKKMKEKKLKS